MPDKACFPPYQFGEKHRAYMRRAATHTLNVAEGAVRAGKTVDNVFVFAMLLEHSPDRIHLASGSTAGNAKLNLADCNGMGLERLFAGRFRWSRYQGNECMLVHTPVGERIILFTGGRTADAYKRIRGNSYGMWIATEINHHHDSFIREAFNRQLAARERRVFWDLNPTSPGAGIYRDYLDRYAAAPSDGFYNYERFTIRDNPTVSPARLAEITAQYDPSSVWYRRDILGERCAAEGLIYRAFANAPETFLVDAPPPLRFANIGVDFGGNRSKTVFVAMGFPVCGGVCALADQAVAGEKGDIDPGRIGREFTRFLAGVRRLYPAVSLRYAFCDNEAQYLVNGLRRALPPGEEIRVADCAKKPILDRIAYVAGLIGSGRFHLTKHCPLLRAGLAEAVWDDTGERRRDDFTSDIDVLDAMEYAIERYMR